MKGTIHAAIGASAPLGLVLTQHATLLQGAVMAGVSAGFALLPDLDHPRSCASRALGSVSHRVIHGLCRIVFHATARPEDERNFVYMRSVRRDPLHRTLTHTLVAAVTVGALAYASGWSQIASGAVAALGVFTLWPLYRRAIGMVILGAAVAAVGASLLLTPWFLALAAGGGYASHVLADGCTKAGVPAFWPLKVKGRRWWNLRLLGRVMSSGSVYESGPALGVSLAANAVLVFLNFR